MNKFITITLAIMLLFIVLVGCTGNVLNPEMNRFVGTWECSTTISFLDSTSYINSTMILFSDGTCDGSPPYSMLEETWEIKDNRLVFNTEIGLDSYSYIFSDDGNTLTLIGNGNGLFIGSSSSDITICLR